MRKVTIEDMKNDSGICVECTRDNIVKALQSGVGIEYIDGLRDYFFIQKGEICHCSLEEYQLDCLYELIWDGKIENNNTEEDVECSQKVELTEFQQGIYNCFEHVITELRFIREYMEELRK